MGRKPVAITLTNEDREKLKSYTRTRTMQAQIVDRARILLNKENAMSNQAIAESLGVDIKTVTLCIDKFKSGGVECALFDQPRKGRPSEISPEAVAWIISVACERPADLGYSQELWTLKNLHQHIQKHAEEAGYPRLSTITKARVQQLLKTSDVKPFKVKYYCEKRDPDFDQKMHDVLLVYKQLEMQFDENGRLIIPDDWVMTHTVSYDEKPGIQAISNTTEDLRPDEKHGEVYRDYEYRRLGTVSLLAGIDLNTGKAIPLVRDTHKSSDFIDFLKILNKEYPQQDTIRIILDNHSAHTSKETRDFLATMPTHRFEFVFTPKHGSWLNLIESFFSKMTKQMLRGIRVNTKQELVDRIYLYFDEINVDPVVYHWRYKLNEISREEAMAI